MTSGVFSARNETRQNAALGANTSFFATKRAKSLLGQFTNDTADETFSQTVRLAVFQLQTKSPAQTAVPLRGAQRDAAGNCCKRIKILIVRILERFLDQINSENHLPISAR